MICSMTVSLMGCGSSTSSAPTETVATESTDEIESMDNTELTVEEIVDTNEADIEEFLVKFENAVNSENMENIINCLAPDVSEKYLGIFKTTELNDDTGNLIFPYIQNPLGLNDGIMYRYWGYVDLTDIEITTYDNSATASYTLQCSYKDGSSGTREGNVDLTKIDGKWYISAQRDQILTGGDRPIKISTSNISEEDSKGNLYIIHNDDEKYGYINGAGIEILPPSYDDMGEFHDGYCPVMLSGFGWGFISDTGNLEVFYSFDGVNCNGYKDGYWPVKINEYWHFYNPSDGDLSSFYCENVGETLVKTGREGNDIWEYDNVIYVEKGGHIGSFEPTTDIFYSYDCDEMFAFKDGLAVAKKNGYWGVINSAGEVVIDYIYDETESEFHSGCLGVGINNNWGVINESGAYIIPIEKDRQIAKTSESGMIYTHTYISGSENYGELYKKDGSLLFENVISFNGKSYMDRVIVEIKIDNLSDYKYVDSKHDFNYLIVKNDGSVIYDAKKVADGLIDDFGIGKDGYYPRVDFETDRVEPSVHRFGEYMVVNFEYGGQSFNEVIDTDGNSVKGVFATTYRRCCWIFGKDNYFTYWNDGHTYIYSTSGTLLDEISTKEFLADFLILNNAVVIDLGDFVRVYSNNSFTQYDDMKYANDRACIIYDGIYYGLYTDDGFVKEGLAYNKISYDKDLDLFTLEKGASTEYYRVPRDGITDYEQSDSISSPVSEESNNSIKSSWNIALFSNPSASFNTDLALVAAQMSQESEDTNDIKIQTLYGEYDIWGVKTYNYGGSAAFVIGQDIFKDGDSDTNVLVITCRGTQTFAELIGDAAKGSTHPFLNYDVFDNVHSFAQKVWTAVEEYVDDNPHLANSSDLLIFINGHSLGGAAANMIGAEIDNRIDNELFFNPNVKKENVYVYTFGAIKVLDTTDNIQEGYENIHNLYNYYDAYGPNGNKSFTNASDPYSKFGHTDMFYLEKEKNSNTDINHWMSTYIEALNKQIISANNNNGKQFIELECE